MKVYGERQLNRKICEEGLFEDSNRDIAKYVEGEGCTDENPCDLCLRDEAEIWSNP